jgi:hypothetical protein
MRKFWKQFVAAGAIGLGLMAAKAEANAIVNYTVTITTNIGGNSGKWQVFESNTYDNNTGTSGFTSASPSSGLDDFNVTVKGTGGVAIGSAATVKAPKGSDAENGFSNGFSTLVGNTFVATGNGSQKLFGGQPLTYQTNDSGDVNSIYTGVGDVAETVNTSDSGDNDPAPGSTILTVSIAKPVLIGTGTWTQNGTGGTITVDLTQTTTAGQALLPTVMPTPTVTNPPGVAAVNPDSITGNSATVAAVPEPASFGLLVAGGLMTLARRRRMAKVA